MRVPVGRQERPRFLIKGKSVRANGTLKDGQRIAALLPPLEDRVFLWARMIAFSPHRLKLYWSGTYLQIAAWQENDGHEETFTNQYLELRLRGIVISGRITKYGVSLL